MPDGHKTRVLTAAPKTESVAAPLHAVLAAKKRVKPKPKLIRTRCEVSASGVLSIHIGHRIRNPLNESIHWDEKRRMKEKFRDAIAVGRPLAVKSITFIRWYPLKSKPFDAKDNLNASFKWFRDAACEWLGIDDGPTCPVELEYEQHVADAYGITVRFS